MVRPGRAQHTHTHISIHSHHLHTHTLSLHFVTHTPHPCLSCLLLHRYPPGHGDLYESLCRSGLLEEPELVGREYLFISNADNLGATVDCNILNMMMNGNEADDEPPCNFIMEVTDKTRADVKGGTLCKYDGCTRLLELAQV